MLPPHSLVIRHQSLLNYKADKITVCMFVLLINNNRLLYYILADFKKTIIGFNFDKK